MYKFIERLTNWLLGGNLSRLADAIVGGEGYGCE